MDRTREKVLIWAYDRGLLKEENRTKQCLKLTEEVGELAAAILKGQVENQMDAIGDIQVVLIILANQLNINYEKALEHAYNNIKDRKGRTVNGTFIKEEDDV
jgi:NTP pyrophosphatase (non-canonical NTP hydrolase)